MLRTRVLDEARREFAEAVQWYREEDLDVARVADHLVPFAGGQLHSLDEVGSLVNGAGA